MIVPMRLRGDVLGTVTMVTAESGRRLGPADVELAEDLGVRAATAVDNSRLYSQRSAIAHTLQASLLPPELPEIERIECAALFRAAGDGFEVGGDFYDVFSTADDQWFAVIGDVCGKGAEAAATTALVRYTVRAAAARRPSPALILRWLNDAMLRSETGPTRFCTLAVVRLDVLADGTVRAVSSSGGHPLPRVVSATGRVASLGGPGTLVGVTPDIVVEEAEAILRPDDTVVLFTDGLTEAGAPARVWSSEELDGALAEAHAGAGRGLQRLVDQLAGAALGDLAADPRDDVAIVALRMR
jgi:serine phosphatase RsbU (regulator of sigma subunit)